MTQYVEAMVEWSETLVYRTPHTIDLDEVREWLIWSAKQSGKARELAENKVIDNQVIEDFISCGDWNPEAEDRDPRYFHDSYSADIEKVLLPGDDEYKLTR